MATALKYFQRNEEEVLKEKLTLLFFLIFLYLSYLFLSLKRQNEEYFIRNDILLQHLP
jgi:hypothetical protein